MSSHTAFMIILHGCTLPSLTYEFDIIMLVNFNLTTETETFV